MTVEETAISLLEQAGLQVYPGSVPEDGTYPNVVFQVISNPVFVRSHQGNEMMRPRLQMTCWAEDYETCVTTANTVIGIFDLNQTDFKLATKESEIDMPEEVEAGYFRRVLDFFVYI